MRGTVAQVERPRYQSEWCPQQAELVIMEPNFADHPNQNSNEIGKSKPVDGNKAATKNRRRLLKAAIAGVPLIMTLSAGKANAQSKYGYKS